MDDDSLLQLIWLASPALPIGSFSYSEGLEAGVEWRFIATESEALSWLTDQLHLSLARADLPLLAQAMAAWRTADLPQLRALNDWMLHTRESAELRLQTEQMGRSFTEWLRLQQPDAAARMAEALGESAISYPIAFALAVASSGASVHQTCLSFAFGWAENMVAAAVKAVPLGQSAGQRILAQLAREVPPAVRTALTQTADARQAFTPMLAILSARHETQYSRLFRS